MSTGAAYRYKVADAPEEFEQIFRLNYETFVEEIPQHPVNAERRLIDRFHAENTYLICLQGTELAGMLALRDKRPFSLDSKIPGLDSYLPSGKTVCEIRLLAVRRPERSRSVFVRLMAAAERECAARGYEIAVISATVRRLRLYRHLGFVPFAEPVGTPEALFQPMYLMREAFAGRDAASRYPPPSEKHL
jgi:GNAT superfamily N-acetyltransferase